MRKHGCALCLILQQSPRSNSGHVRGSLGRSFSLADFHFVRSRSLLWSHSRSLALPPSVRGEAAAAAAGAGCPGGWCCGKTEPTGRSPLGSAATAPRRPGRRPRPRRGGGCWRRWVEARAPAEKAASAAEARRLRGCRRGSAALGLGQGQRQPRTNCGNGSRYCCGCRGAAGVAHCSPPRGSRHPRRRAAPASKPEACRVPAKCGGCHSARGRPLTARSASAAAVREPGAAAADRGPRGLTSGGSPGGAMAALRQATPRRRSARHHRGCQRRLDEATAIGVASSTPGGEGARWLQRRWETAQRSRRRRRC